MKELPTVADCMAKRPRSLAPDTPILDAIKFLLKHRISGAPVVDADGKLVGIISEKDCLKLVARGVDNRPPTGCVADFMSREVRCIPSNMDIYFAAGRFLAEVFRRFPVVDDGRLVGQISRRDLLAAMLANLD